MEIKKFSTDEAYENLIDGQIKTLYSVLTKINGTLNVSVSAIRSRERDLTESIWDIECPKQVKKAL